MNYAASPKVYGLVRIRHGQKHTRHNHRKKIFDNLQKRAFVLLHKFIDAIVQVQSFAFLK